MLTSALPLLIVSSVLFTGVRPPILTWIVLGAGLLSLAGCIRILYDIGHLPKWSVFFLITDYLLIFAFLSFAMQSTHSKEAFVSALHRSLTNYIGLTPDLIQSTVGLFINLVVIAKFVQSF